MLRPSRSVRAESHIVSLVSANPVRGEIQSVEAVCLIHGTENLSKVETALTKLLSVERQPEVERLEGHFGNVILRARIHCVGDEAMKAFLSIVSKLPDGLKREIASGIASFVDEHSALYLRFDKQALVAGSVTLGTRDTIRVKVKPRPYLVKGRASEFFRELLLGR